MSGKNKKKRNKSKDQDKEVSLTQVVLTDSLFI